MITESHKKYYDTFKHFYGYEAAVSVAEIDRIVKGFGGHCPAVLPAMRDYFTPKFERPFQMPVQQHEKLEAVCFYFRLRGQAARDKLEELELEAQIASDETQVYHRPPAHTEIVTLPSHSFSGRAYFG